MTNENAAENKENNKPGEPSRPDESPKKDINTPPPPENQVGNDTLDWDELGLEDLDMSTPPPQTAPAFEPQDVPANPLSIFTTPEGMREGLLPVRVPAAKPRTRRSLFGRSLARREELNQIINYTRSLQAQQQNQTLEGPSSSQIQPPVQNPNIGLANTFQVQEGSSSAVFDVPSTSQVQPQVNVPETSAPVIPSKKPTLEIPKPVKPKNVAYPNELVIQKIKEAIEYKETTTDVLEKKFCSCRSSTGCTRGYCDCAKGKMFCSSTCKCTNCNNNMEKLKEGLQLLEDIGVLEDPSDTTEIRELRIKTIETFEPLARLFLAKVEDKPILCNCKSGCGNGYCKCFKSSQKCGLRCGCVNCRNPKGVKGEAENEAENGDENGVENEGENVAQTVEAQVDEPQLIPQPEIQELVLETTQCPSPLQQEIQSFTQAMMETDDFTGAIDIPDSMLQTPAGGVQEEAIPIDPILNEAGAEFFDDFDIENAFVTNQEVNTPMAVVRSLDFEETNPLIVTPIDQNMTGVDYHTLSLGLNAFPPSALLSSNDSVILDNGEHNLATPQRIRSPSPVPEETTFQVNTFLSTPAGTPLKPPSNNTPARPLPGPSALRLSRANAVNNRIANVSAPQLTASISSPHQSPLRCGPSSPVKSPERKSSPLKRKRGADSEAREENPEKQRRGTN